MRPPGSRFLQHSVDDLQRGDRSTRLVDGIRRPRAASTGANHESTAPDKLNPHSRSRRLSLSETFDVFLSHNSKDKPAVRQIAEALRARGLEVWLDEWNL